MKIVLLAVVLGVVACVAVFVAGLFSPRISSAWQRTLGRLLGRVEDKTDESGGRMGDMTRASAEKTRHAIDNSGRAGRAVHDAVTPGADDDERTTTEGAAAGSRVPPEPLP